MKKRFWGILAVFALLLGLCFSMNVLAEYPAVSGSAPLKAYGWQSRDYTVSVSYTHLTLPTIA